MPVAVARKIEFILHKSEQERDIRLYPLVLTAEQIRRFQLPRIPIKDSESRKKRFEQRHGEGAEPLFDSRRDYFEQLKGRTKHFRGSNCMKAVFTQNWALQKAEAEARAAGLLR